MELRTVSAEELAQAQRFEDNVPVYRVDAKTVVKTGDCVRLAEAAAMILVRKQTSIPVPEVYNAYTDPATGRARIVMEFIEGERLAEAWEHFDAEQKQHVLDQLRGFMLQLRNIKGTFIGSVDGTYCEDQLFTEDLGAYGPYESEADFNQGIITALKDIMASGWVDTVCNMVAALKGHEIVMTHGDLAPRNILVQGTKVVAVLDWEFSGFYPEYWEYVKALYRPAWEGRWIKDSAVDRILMPYMEELAVMLHVNSVGAW